MLTMFRAVIIIFCLLACCYCSESNELFEERAKNKKSSAKLWGIILLVIIAKLAVSKVFSIVMLSMFFQKLFSIGGVFLKYFLSNKSSIASMYGTPEYNTVGYSYGPPEGSTSSGSNGENGLDWIFNRES